MIRENWLSLDVKHSHGSGKYVKSGISIQLSKLGEYEVQRVISGYFRSDCVVQCIFEKFGVSLYMK